MFSGYTKRQKNLMLERAGFQKHRSMKNEKSSLFPSIDVKVYFQLGCMLDDMLCILPCYYTSPTREVDLAMPFIVARVEHSRHVVIIAIGETVG
jgi:hypothetical protein